ncbi:unnamed protein product [Gongylonema pulchrum]|uniref:ATP-dependent DNA helicase n=1 Tax=Gongylonema pulchrum TaxID=637853 RepID=A0A183DNS2_9BILA|nr:unnamed protein product [Gongylonema pulchrum]
MKNRPIFLFSSNAEVDKWNEKVLREMPGTEAVSEASDHVAGDGSESAKRVILLSVNNDRVTTQQTMGLPRVLQLKVGARYMMTYNLDTSDGLTNGATGRLVHIDMSQQRPGINAPRKPLRVWMVFDEPTVGTNLRRRYSAIIAGLQHPPDWTPLEPTTVTIKRNKSSNLQVLRKQFPMVPAEAIAIHKSQGQTCASVVHKARRMTRALLYVVLSCVTSLAGLFIIGFFVPPKKPHPNDPLQRQDRCC